MAKMILTVGSYGAEKGSWNWITDGSTKFSYAVIDFWFADLPNMTYSGGMFQWSSIRFFDGDLPASTNGNNMFYNCSSLRSFKGDLHKTLVGRSMFNNCSSLRFFEGDLSALIEGTSMFNSCKLDLASVQNIANTINTVSSGTIKIGMSASIKGDADLATALEAIRAKGWTVEEQYNS